MIIIKLNGQAVSMPKSVSLETFLIENSLATQGGVAVALNQAVVQKKSWSTIALQNNDDIIIITATQGG